MSPPRRLLPALPVVVAAFASGATMQSSDPAGVSEVPPHRRIHLPSLTACGICHPQAYGEWARSLHHRAWTNANVRAATRNFTLEECRSCHSPMPVLPHGLEQPPRYRDFNQQDGVHCLSCHGLRNGVAAARTIPEAPCRPRAVPGFIGKDSCLPCHEPTHQAYQEYRQSRAFAYGVRCIDCHMPLRDDLSGRSHGPHGGLDSDFVRRAFVWDCREVPGGVQVTLTNRTGHKFPGEIPSRVFLVRVEFTDGEISHTALRRPGKKETRPDNRLAPDEERTLFFASSGAGVRSVRFLWKPYPLLPEEAAWVLAEWLPR